MVDLLEVGKIVNTHGLRGEVKVLPLTDFPEVRFAAGSELFVFLSERPPIPVTVQSGRMHKNMYIVRFKQYSHINEVEKWKGSLLKVTKEERVALPENEFYFYEIIGCDVVTEQGEQVGTISEILTPGANDVWVVDPAPAFDKEQRGKQILLPVIPQVVLHVDTEHKKVKVHLMEGLL